MMDEGLVARVRLGVWCPEALVVEGRRLTIGAQIEGNVHGEKKCAESDECLYREDRGGYKRGAMIETESERVCKV